MIVGDIKLSLAIHKQLTKWLTYQWLRKKGKQLTGMVIVYPKNHKQNHRKDNQLFMRRWRRRKKIINSSQLRF